MISYTQVWDPVTKRANPDLIRVEENDRVYFISNDPKNIDWVRYREWRSRDNNPSSEAPPAEPKAIPSLEVMYDELMILKVKVETLERDLRELKNAPVSSADNIASNATNGTGRSDNNN